MSAENKCAWKGCKASFSGDMPYGWEWLMTYWWPTADIMLGTVKDACMHRDAVLCPHHSAALGTVAQGHPLAHQRCGWQGLGRGTHNHRPRSLILTTAVAYCSG
jgi:hypothetical protein